MRLKMKSLPPPPKKCFSKIMALLLVPSMMLLDKRIFEQIKNIERAHEVWKKLEEPFEGTQAMKGAKAYNMETILSRLGSHWIT